MQHSVDKILTSHAGSLPRADEIHPSIVWAKPGALAEDARIETKQLWGHG